MGFEPTIRFPVYTLSKRAPSATRPPLRRMLRRAQYSRQRSGDNPSESGPDSSMEIVVSASFWAENHDGTVAPGTRSHHTCHLTGGDHGTRPFALAYRNSAADHSLDLVVRRTARLSGDLFLRRLVSGRSPDWRSCGQIRAQGKPGNAPGFSVFHNPCM